MKKILIFFILLFISNKSFATNYCTGDAACYLFTEGSGTTLGDSSGNNNTGTFSSSGHPGWTASGLPFTFLANATVSSAATDYISIPASASINNVQPISISFWAKCTDASGAKFVISKFSTGSYPTGVSVYYDIQTATTSFIHFSKGFSTTAGDWRNSAASAFNQTLWHNFTITYDDSSTSNNPVIYIDGVNTPLSTPITPPAGTPTSDSAAPIHLGETVDAAFTFDGSMSQIAIFNSILSSSDALAIYNNGLKPFVVVASNVKILGQGKWTNVVFK